jgi:hypothetical protein
VESAKVYSLKMYKSAVSMLQNGENGKMWVKTSTKTSVITAQKLIKYKTFWV